MASLFARPDRELADHLSGVELHALFHDSLSNLGGKVPSLDGFRTERNPEHLHMDLKEEYERLFSGIPDEPVSLAESCYKPWTLDPACLLPFASEKELLMGDSAFHLLDLYRFYGLQLPDEFRGMPDHLVLELEFLSYLYQGEDDLAVKRFLEDHLDWVSSLKEALLKRNPHPFYETSIKVIDFYLEKEKKRLEIINDGKKNALSKAPHRPDAGRSSSDRLQQGRKT